MIVQITIARNEQVLIKELLPTWKQYADGFVFLLDKNTDDTRAYLESVRAEYNILEILENNEPDSKLPIETDKRQLLFDTGRKYSNKIICLDADEYLDGDMTKDELSSLLESKPDTLFLLEWVQYTSVNTIRVDGPWKYNLKDRVGTYNTDAKFLWAQMHSQHLPNTTHQTVLPKEKLFIAHLQWLDKTYVAVKQYFWKVEDYVNNTIHGADVVGNFAYDASVNNFDWEEEYTMIPLKVSPWIIQSMATFNNYRLSIIKTRIIKYSIPNLGDWGYDFLSMDETMPVEINKYKISVITAIGDNRIYEKYIPRWISNAKEQHFFRETEHIIVYKEWSQYFEELKTLENFVLIKQGDTGMYNAWNAGIKAATTLYVTNWNIDDLRHPINTKIKYDLLKNNPSVDMVYNWYAATSDENATFHTIDFTAAHVSRYPDDFHRIVFENCYAGPDPMWKRELHDRVGYFNNENFPTIGDWEMWIRFAVSGAVFKLLPEVLCIYLDHESTVSKRQNDRIKYEQLLIKQKYAMGGNA
jgi:hypothetical protein